MKKTNLRVVLATLLLVAAVIIQGGCRFREEVSLPTQTPESASTAPPATVILPKGEVDLSFETIGNSEGSGYSLLDPRLVIIAKEEELNALENIVPENAWKDLQSLDFGRYFAFAVFQGLKVTNMYGVDIQRLARNENIIILYTHFTERDPEMGAADVMTSPYHLVKVRKDGLQGEIEFILNVDGIVLSRQPHFIP